jgi:hypothetical protein
MISNLGRHDLLKNKNKLQLTHIPCLHTRELHVRGVLKCRWFTHLSLTAYAFGWSGWFIIISHHPDLPHPHHFANVHAVPLAPPPPPPPLQVSHPWFAQCVCCRVPCLRLASFSTTSQQLCPSSRWSGGLHFPCARTPHMPHQPSARLQYHVVSSSPQPALLLLHACSGTCPPPPPHPPHLLLLLLHSSSLCFLGA